jgi:hypothetical protein
MRYQPLRRIRGSSYRSRSRAASSLAPSAFAFQHAGRNRRNIHVNRGRGLRFETTAFAARVGTNDQQDATVLCIRRGPRVGAGLIHSVGLLTRELRVATLLNNVAVIEAADASHLDRLLAAGLERFVVARLGDHAVLVDHERAAAVRKLLTRLGETPGLVTG